VATSDLDRVDLGSRHREAARQHSFPRPDLEHDVLGPQRRVPHDRVEQVGVGQEVLPEADHRYQPKRARAFASTVRSSSA
jgi:hypothetical protein